MSLVYYGQPGQSLLGSLMFKRIQFQIKTRENCMPQGLAVTKQAEYHCRKLHNRISVSHKKRHYRNGGKV